MSGWAFKGQLVWGQGVGGQQTDVVLSKNAVYLKHSAGGAYDVVSVSLPVPVHKAGISRIKRTAYIEQTN